MKGDTKEAGTYMGTHFGAGVGSMLDPSPVSGQSKAAQICATEIGGAHLSRPIGVAPVLPMLSLALPRKCAPASPRYNE